MRSLVRLLLTALLAQAVLLAAPASGQSQDNTAVAENEKDGKSVFKLAFSVKKATGEVDAANTAVAYSSCTDCRTVAAAIQVVLVSGEVTSATAENVAIAINYECTECETLAAAYQFVFGDGQELEFTNVGKAKLHDLKKRFHDLKQEDLTLEELAARIAVIAAEVAVVVDTRNPGQEGLRGVIHRDHGDHGEHDGCDVHDHRGPEVVYDHPRGSDLHHVGDGVDHRFHVDHVDDPPLHHHDHLRVRRGRAAVALAGLMVATGCGGSSEAVQALAKTEAALNGIRSGTLSMLVLASPLTAAEGQGAGFQVQGPFAVGEAKGSLPVADLRYTRITGTERRTTRFVSTGTRAFVEADGRLTELNETQVADLRVKEEGSAGGLDGLSLRRWLDDAKLEDGPVTDGAPTDKVTGRADAVAILNDVIGLSEQFGGGGSGVRRLEGEAAGRVRRAVTGAQAEVVTGREDRLLRGADVSVDLAVTDPKVREALGDLAGARLALALEVKDLNRPVEVGVPQPQGGRR